MMKNKGADRGWKKRRIIWNSVMAVAVALCFLNFIRAEEASILLRQGEDGSYRVVEATKARVMLLASEGSLWIRCTPNQERWKQVAIILFCVLILKPWVVAASEKPAVVIYDPKIVLGHPLYNEFLAEDVDRMELNGDELVLVFSNWLADQPDGKVDSGGQ